MIFHVTSFPLRVPLDVKTLRFQNTSTRLALILALAPPHPGSARRNLGLSAGFGHRDTLLTHVPCARRCKIDGFDSANTRTPRHSLAERAYLGAKLAARPSISPSPLPRGSIELSRSKGLYLFGHTVHECQTHRTLESPTQKKHCAELCVLHCAIVRTAMPELCRWARSP